MRLLKAVVALSLMLSTGLTQAHGDHNHGKSTVVLIQVGPAGFQVAGQAKGAPLRLKAGERYELVFENVGTAEHEVRLGREPVSKGRGRGFKDSLLRNVTVLVMGQQPVAGQLRTVEVEAFGLRQLFLEPGTGLVVSFRLPATAKGAWELGSFIGTQYESGMRLELIVE